MPPPVLSLHVACKYVPSRPTSPFPHFKTLTLVCLNYLTGKHRIRGMCHTAPRNPIKVEGFGVTIGRTLALLHVVRHGLRSQELWSLLTTLEAYSSAQEKV